MNVSKLESVIDKFFADPQLTGIVAAVAQGSGRTSPVWTAARGDFDPETPFFIASTTKLYTAAIIFRLCERGDLRLDDRVVDLLPGLGALHVDRRNRDATDRITARHLLAHNSGLPDYFQGSAPGSDASLEDQLRSGQDRSWTFDEALAMSRAMKPPFAPGTPRRARYSDTNYQLLGQVIEQTTVGSYAEAVDSEIVQTLGHRSTWLYADASDQRPTPLRLGENQLPIPLAMTSFGPDGGIVSTAGELMEFVQAFFAGKLFDSAWLDIATEEFRRINFPLTAGTGVLRFAMPKLLNPIGPKVELIGHSGLSGAFAFHAPDHDLYFAGTVNNVDKPQRPFKLMVQLLNAAV